MSLSFRKRMTVDEYEASAEQHSTLWYVGRVIALILVFGTIGILLWRIFTSGDPAEMKVLQVNRPLMEAYRAAEEEGRELSVFYNDSLPNITYEPGRRGYFSATRVRFIEDADQVQVVFRYNNSTIRHLKEDYQLSEMPSRDDDLYDLTLYVAYDLTPEDTSDNAGNDPASVKFLRYHPTSVVSQKKGLYNYRAVVFDGLDINVSDTPVLAVYLDIYYKDDVHYVEDEDGKEPYSALIIYDYTYKRKPYSLTGKDKKQIEKWDGDKSAS